MGNYEILYIMVKANVFCIVYQELVLKSLLDVSGLITEVYIRE